MSRSKSNTYDQNKSPAFLSKLEKLDIFLDPKKFEKDFLSTFCGKVCLFCGVEEDNEDKYGAFVHHVHSGIYVHYFCLLLASGLVQRCQDSDCDKTRSPKSLYGFYIKDIIEEFKRGAKLRCTFCFKRGATIGCNTPRCRTRFHFNCGLERQALFQYYGSFPSFCKKHKPTQTVSEVGSLKNSSKDADILCCMCFERFDSTDKNYLLTSPCCKETHFHSECVQKQALASGLYYFRCPTCNNKDEYTKEMLRMGIYIPDRDASWETPEAFIELLENHFQCDVTVCQCLHGRKHDSSQTLWEIVVCLFCGSSGSHLACSSLESSSTPFVCEICSGIYGQSGVRKTLLNMGFQANQLIFNEPAITPLKEVNANGQKVSRQSLKRKIVAHSNSQCIDSPRAKLRKRK